MRVSGPTVPSAHHRCCCGDVVTRPRCGLRPKSPQNAAGIRIEPPPSPPMPTGTMPDATAAAVPPLEPPGGEAGRHGLRVYAEGLRLGVGPGAELRHLRLADDHRARRAQPAYDLAVWAWGC